MTGQEVATRPPAGSSVTPVAQLLTPQQYMQLLSGLQPWRIVAASKDQPNQYLEAWDVRRFLNRIFGFGNWDGEVVDTTLVFEDLYDTPDREHNGKTIKGRPAVDVGYRVRYRLTVYNLAHTVSATYTEEAAAGPTNFPRFKRADAHDFAVKSAASGALKRTAMNLGDQFGLSMYGGKTRDVTVPIVQATIVGPGLPQLPPGQSVVPAIDTGEQVVPEDSGRVPDDEVEWVDATEALEPDDHDIFDTLYNQARAAKVTQATLSRMRQLREVPRP